LTDQIRDYFVDVDRQQGTIDVDALIRRLAEERARVALIEPRRADGRSAGGRAGWLAGLAAAAAVLLVVALTVVPWSDPDEPRDLSTDESPASTTSSPTTSSTAPPTTTPTLVSTTLIPTTSVAPVPPPQGGAAPGVTVGPGAWTVAATFTGGVPVGSSIADVVDQVRGWDGVLDVVAVNEASQWTELIGLTSNCTDGVAAPPCGPGLAVLTLDSSMSPVAVRLQTELTMSVVTAVDVPAEYLQGYVDAAIERASPVALEFDPSAFGVEQPLTGPIRDVPDECHCDVAVEADTGGVLVRAGLDVAPEDVQGDVGFGFGSSGTVYPLDYLLIDDIGRSGVLVESHSVLGRQVYALAGLPLQAALIYVDLSDGSRVWQRPLAGMAIIVDAPNSGVEDPGSPAAGPYIVLDSVGREIMRVEDTTDGLHIHDFRLGDASSTGPVAGGEASFTAELVATIDAEPLLFDRATHHLVEAGGALWLHAPHGARAEVIYVDTETGDAGRIPIGGQPQTLAASPDALWVGSISDETAIVSRVDLGSRTVTDTIDIPGTFDPGRIDSIVADGGVWLSGSSAGFVIIDLATRAVRVLPTNGRLHAQWVGEIDGGLWAYAAPSDGQSPSALTRTDLGSGVVERFDTPQIGSEAGAVAANDAIWLAGWAGDVVRFDTRTRDITDRMDLGTGLGWNGLFADDAMWYLNYFTDTVTRIDAASARTTAAITVEQLPIATLAHDGAIWMLHAGGQASRLDTDTQQVTGVVELGPQVDPSDFIQIPLPLVSSDEAVWVVTPDGRVHRLVALA
jgi:hypothetical protein